MISLRLFSALVIMVFWTNCTTYVKVEDVMGTYVAQGYLNTIDTLRLMPEGVYERVVYTSGGRPALSVKNNWEFRTDGEIVLHAFFLNLDRDLSEFPELTEDPGYQINTYMHDRSGSLEFCTGHYEGENCYRRISQ